MDSWGHAQDLIDDLRKSLKESQLANAEKQATIVQLGGRLDTERQERWEAEDAAARHRRQVELLEEQNTELRRTNENLEDLVEINRELRDANGELVRHVYSCELKARKLERNLQTLWEAARDGKAPLGQWEGIDHIPDVELERMRHMAEDSEAEDLVEQKAELDEHSLEAELSADLEGHE